MQMCIELAKKGKPSPNPYVGCIVLDKFGNVISEGYHKKCGENHAERDALLKLKNGEEEGGTLIVNLEPCSHYGKTPPCTDLIIERKIKRVVIGMRDVNLKVNGVEVLRDAGIEVIEGVLKDECERLNEVFIKNMKDKKTFIALKSASTLDGKIATAGGSSKWITSENARNHVKKLRSLYDAIMTSSATVIADNPSMDHDIKIILDRNLRSDINSKIYQSGKIFVFHDEKLSAENNNIEYIKTPVQDGKLDLDFIFAKLFELGIMSVFVESGGKLSGEVLKYADKIYQFIAPKITGDNSSKSSYDFRKITDINESIELEISSAELFPPDILLTCYPISKSIK